jgi:hypothetical protein
MNEHDENENLQVSAKLAEALRNFQKERVFVSAEVDEKILAQAHQHLREQKRRIVFLPRWAAMAASVALVGGLIYFSQTRNQNFAVKDINRDGDVDILDAFALARKIEAGEKAADLNHDGEIDQRDIETITSDVVRLDKGGQS